MEDHLENFCWDEIALWKSERKREVLSGSSRNVDLVEND